jgi:peptidoglycan hydrolase CwlO-like protein
MESTLTQMRLVLKKMDDKAAKSKTQDSLAKANLDMWELMVSHLDKELRELKIAMAAREDMEARRAALYKQADAKVEAEAQAARAAEAAKFAAGAPAPAGQGAGQSPAGQTAPGQPSPAPAANNSPSPN